MFDEFMEELRRRQQAQEAAAKGEAPKGDDSGDASPADETREEEKMRNDGPGPDDTDRDDEERDPRPIFGGARRTRSGGPSGELPEFKISRGWVILGALFVIFTLASSLACSGRVSAPRSCPSRPGP
jgi:hypothetical protein